MTIYKNKDQDKLLKNAAPTKVKIKFKGRAEVIQLKNERHRCLI